MQPRTGGAGLDSRVGCLLQQRSQPKPQPSPGVGVAVLGLSHHLPHLSDSRHPGSGEETGVQGLGSSVLHIWECRQVTASHAFAVCICRMALIALTPPASFTACCKPRGSYKLCAVQKRLRAGASSFLSISLPKQVSFSHLPSTFTHDHSVCLLNIHQLDEGGGMVSKLTVT